MLQIRNASLLEAIFATKGNFADGITPRRKVLSGIEIAPFRNDAEAASCISADFEMGWGWRSLGRDGANEMGERERRHLPMILALLAEYSVPITWATIGHLFLDSCTRSSSGVAHATMPRPHSDGTWQGDWYWPDPCSNMGEAPSWYGPDLIQQIIESHVPHEIGTHSFSHINFQAPYSCPNVVAAELEACIDVMKPFGLKPRTLIFPRHQAEYSYLPLLARLGISVVRHRDAQVRLSYPERMASGVYRIYESMNLRIARHYDYLDKAKIFITKAMKRRAAYALWFHPSDPAEWFDPQLRAILEYMVEERQRGRLWITTMQQLAAYCEAREQLQLTTQRDEHSLTVTIDNAFDTSRYGTTDVTLIVPVSKTPQSAWLVSVKDETVAARVRYVSDDRARVIVNVPTGTKALHLTF